MPNDSEQFDFFVSYARKDNEQSWITRFLDGLQAEHRAFTGGRKFRCFFDKEDIHSLDAWQHRIYDSLAASRLFLAFVSPAYFASEWCRREWRTWIDIEIAKHVLSDGAAPIYIVEVPWLDGNMTEQEVAESIARLTKKAAADLQPGLAADAMKVTGQMSLRQLTQVRNFYTEGLDALRRDDLHKVLVTLAKDLEERAQHVADAAKSQSTIPPYNRRFVGRLEELVKLRERLFQGRTGVISGHKEGALPQERAGFASVHGLGGIGKTELAFTYAHAFAGLYAGGRFLIQCEHLTDLRQALLQLDSLFPGAATDEQRKSLELHFGAIREALRQRLVQMGRILLVLDNVSDLALLAPEQTDLVRILGPQLHLLATTRLGAPVGQDAGDDVHWLTLGELTFEDSLRLLEKHRSFSEGERDAAEKIARRLGGFALCVEVVGAYLGQHPEESYASFLEKMGLEDLEQVDIAAERKETVTRRHNNEKRLGNILALTLAKLTSAEQTTLEFASLLAPDHVVLLWLPKLVGEVHPALATNATAWQRLIARLTSLALLTRGDGDDQALDECHQPRVLRCHRLVQSHLRDRLNDKAKLETAIYGLIRDRITSLEQSTHLQDTKWEVPPLAALALVWAENRHDHAAWLLDRAGQRLRATAEWGNAEDLLKRAICMDTQIYGNAHESVARNLNSMALLLQDTNRLAEAEPLLRRALEIEERVSGPTTQAVAIRLNNLATNLHALGRTTEAESLLRRALEIDTEHFGPTHIAVAFRLNNLAPLLAESGRPDEAEQMYSRVINIFEQQVERPPSEYPNALQNLGGLLMASYRLQDAEPLLRRALELREQNIGVDHPGLGPFLINLAQLLLITNRSAEAEPLLRRAVAISENPGGKPLHGHTGALNSLAEWMIANQRPEEARQILSRALAQEEQASGVESPELCPILKALAQLLQGIGRKEEAEEQLRRAVHILEHSGDDARKYYPAALHDLGIFCSVNGRSEEAESILQKALAFETRANGQENLEAAPILNSLSLLYQQTGRLEHAEALLRRAIAIFENPRGRPLSSGLSPALNNLAGLLVQKEGLRSHEAEQLLRRALEIDQQALGNAHPKVEFRRSNLERFLQASRQQLGADGFAGIAQLLSTGREQFGGRLRHGTPQQIMQDLQSQESLGSEILFSLPPSMQKQIALRSIASCGCLALIALVLFISWLASLLVKQN